MFKCTEKEETNSSLLEMNFETLVTGFTRGTIWSQAEAVQQSTVTRGEMAGVNGQQIEKVKTFTAKKLKSISLK